MSAPGGLPQPGAQLQAHHHKFAPMGRKLTQAGPGPHLQALPQPGPLPELPQPQEMAPMSAPGGLPQPGAQLQAHHHKYAPMGRKLHEWEAMTDMPMPEAIQPFAAEAPMPEPIQPFAAEAPAAGVAPPLCLHRVGVQALGKPRCMLLLDPTDYL